MRKSKGIGCEVKVMELGMRITRARARTLAMESANTTRKNKKNKRKFDSRELEQCRSNCRRLLVRRRRTRSETLRNSGEEDIPTTSRCSSNGSSELVNENLMKSRSVIDLDEQEEKNDKSKSSTSTSTCKRRRRRRRRRRKGEKEITPSTSFREESTTNNLESMERPSSVVVVVSRNNDDNERSEKISPTEAEIDDFFSTPEKEEEKRFANKYNYDIAKDVPLNGRYEWVCLKP